MPLEKITTESSTSGDFSLLTGLSNILPILSVGLQGTTGALLNSPSELAWRNISPGWGWIFSSSNWHWSHTLSAQPHYNKAAPALSSNREISWVARDSYFWTDFPHLGPLKHTHPLLHSSSSCVHLLGWNLEKYHRQNFLLPKGGNNSRIWVIKAAKQMN